MPGRAVARFLSKMSRAPPPRRRSALSTSPVAEPSPASPPSPRTLHVFDFDSTLAMTALPEEGKEAWHRLTGKVRAHTHSSRLSAHPVCSRGRGRAGGAAPKVCTCHPALAPRSPRTAVRCPTLRHWWC